LEGDRDAESLQQGGFPASMAYVRSPAGADIHGMPEVDFKEEKEMD